MQGTTQQILSAVKAAKQSLEAVVNQNPAAITRILDYDNTKAPRAVRDLKDEPVRRALIDQVWDEIDETNPVVTPHLIFQGDGEEAAKARLAQRDLFHANRYTMIRAAHRLARQQGQRLSKQNRRFAAEQFPVDEHLAIHSA